MTVGTFAAFFAYVGMVLMPVRELGQMVTLWQRGASGTQRLFEILDAEPEVRRHAGSRGAPRDPGSHRAA
jgi:ATP-binding cassette, subfamily B, bacterial